MYYQRVAISSRIYIGVAAPAPAILLYPCPSVLHLVHAHRRGDSGGLRRSLYSNLIRGTLPASLSALTKLDFLCAAAAAAACGRAFAPRTAPTGRARLPCHGVCVCARERVGCVCARARARVCVFESVCVGPRRRTSARYYQNTIYTRAEYKWHVAILTHL